MFPLATTFTIFCAFNVLFTIGEDCSLEGVASCFKWLIPGDLEATCSMLNETTCQQRKFAACGNTSIMQEQFSYANYILGSICAFQGTPRTVYQKHKDCYINITTEYDKCNKQYTEVMSRSATQEQIVARKCCAMNQALDCAIAATVHDCKPDATLYPKEVVGITKEYHFKYQCNTYRKGSKDCQPYDFLKSFGNTLTISFGLFSTLALYFCYVNRMHA